MKNSEIITRYLLQHDRSLSGISQVDMNMLAEKTHLLTSTIKEELIKQSKWLQYYQKTNPLDFGCFRVTLIYSNGVEKHPDEDCLTIMDIMLPLNLPTFSEVAALKQTSVLVTLRDKLSADSRILRAHIENSEDDTFHTEINISSEFYDASVDDSSDNSTAGSEQVLDWFDQYSHWLMTKFSH